MNNSKIARNLRKPKGKLGRQIGEELKINENVYKQFEEIIDLKKTKQILEIGFGPGIGIKYYLGKYPVHLDGIDFSKDMYDLAKHNCKKYLDEGRVNLEKADIKNWKSDKLYDLIYFFNVIYFFDDLNIYLEKVITHLEKNGMIGIFMDGLDVLNSNPVTMSSLFNKYSVDQVKNELEKLGIINIKVVEHRDYKGSFYIVGILN
jgi:trans-aconitate methyltransferase